VNSAGVGQIGTIPRSAAQTRILIAALNLFADHGVSGTSLQMIADALGVTKAAVYHQFKTKDENHHRGHRDATRAAGGRAGGCGGHRRSAEGKGITAQ
jgi:AcrR family transcriptional regulator